MTSNHVSISRRTLIGAAIGSAVWPGLAWAQSDGAQAEEVFMTIRCRFGDHDFTVDLYDGRAARDFAAMLPLELPIKDFSNNEKIAYLPEKLTLEGRRDIENEAPGDLCYFIPWGNLAFFYGDYTYRDDLIRLGRMKNWQEPLADRGEYTLRIEAVS
ncbi:cyclophilin-like fold protein [Jiella avicenniae]|uniref:MFS transporter n=1 Tax=Jiella avicenniae TaxID=2907202 RepID=A0A9X1P1C4_9HYPH|nr:cyclophilin-like fold protein [Jiella avicenniae]MCE7029587.1 MFS transporter [Jiella avicenniae]